MIIKIPAISESRKPQVAREGGYTGAGGGAAIIGTALGGATGMGGGGIGSGIP